MNQLVMKRMSVLAAIALALPLGLGGCFIVGKKPGTSTASQPSTGEHKNHGQQRKQEVHDRNADRKDDKDAAKANKK
jgi:hypothetical protein